MMMMTVPPLFERVEGLKVTHLQSPTAMPHSKQTTVVEILSCTVTTPHYTGKCG
jgi:hypothetical protein